MRKYKFFEYGFGYRSPQIQIQFMPLQWSIGAGIGGGKMAFGIGPLSIAFWYSKPYFELIARTEKELN